MKLHAWLAVIVGLLALAVSAVAQTAAPNSSLTLASAQVPPVIQLSNVATDAAGGPLTGTVEITFSLYNNSQGGASLWSETQNVTLGSAGQYSVYLGITKPLGVPLSLFTSGEAHWLGVQIAGQAEQTRVYLVSVPYAMKAGDAATIGGLPPSAFVLAAPGASGVAVAGAISSTAANSSATTAAGNAAPPATTTVTTTGGKRGYLSAFSGTSTIVDSAVTQTGTGTTAVISVPSLTATGNVTATGTVTGGTVSGGVVNATTGFDLGGSLFASGSLTTDNAFVGFAGGLTQGGTYNTGSGIGALNNSTGSYNTAAGYAALALNNTGSYNIATGYGALNRNTTGNYNSAAGTGALLFNTTGSYNTATGYNALYSNTGSTAINNTATGYNALYSNTTGDSNTATGLNALLGNTTGIHNAATGMNALSSSTTGSKNTADGYSALINNTTGYYNTASGDGALFGNTAGYYNTGIGFLSGQATDGSSLTLNPGNNTFLGEGTAFSGGATLTNSTAVGALAEVDEPNALVLGAILNTNGCLQTNNCQNTMVGIGTTKPTYTLDVEAPAGGTSGPTVNFGSTAVPAALTVNGNTTLAGNLTVTGTINGGGGGGTGVASVTGAASGGVIASPTTGAVVLSADHSVVAFLSDITNAENFATNAASNAQTAAEMSASSTFVPLAGGTMTGPLNLPANGLVAGTNQLVLAGGNVGIGTATPAATLDVGGTINAAGSINAAIQFNLGGSQFASGSATTGNAFVGFAGNSTLLGTKNTAIGFEALRFNTLGDSNTATGYNSLWLSTGAHNTATGFGSLQSLVDGYNNSALGYMADVGNGALSNATAIGAYAQVTTPNAIVLGSILNTNGCSSSSNTPCGNTMVGIGTTAPTATLDVEAPAGGMSGPTVNFGSTAVPAALTVNGNTTLSNASGPALTVGNGKMSIDGSSGLITFATGQTFGSGGGINSVTAAMGSGINAVTNNGNVALSIDPTVVPTLTGNNIFSGTNTITGSVAGNGANLTNVNAALLNGMPASAFVPVAGGTMTGPLNLPANGLVAGTNQLVLTGGNVGIGTATPAATLDVNGTINAATQFNLGGQPFAFGTPYANSLTGSNVYVGFAGNQNPSNSGALNTALGNQALAANTTGSSNTAAGFDALPANTSGYSNTAVGVFAGSPVDSSNLTLNPGSNTFLGAGSGYKNGSTLTNATAVGAYAEVDEPDALVLGSIAGTNGATMNTTVGIGTTSPNHLYMLDVESPATGPNGVYVNGNLTVTGTCNGCGSGSGGGGVTTVTGTTGGGITSSPTTGNVGLSLTPFSCSSNTALVALPGACSTVSFATLEGNSFNGTQSVTGNISATGSVSGTSLSGQTVSASTSYSLGGFTFLTGGTPSSQDVFLGQSAGNTTTAGINQVAVGAFALTANNSEGIADNTAVGAYALHGDTGGTDNTAVGYESLYNNTAGINNTALGYLAGPSSSSSGLYDATAIGAYADVEQSYSLVLGSILGTNGCTAVHNCATTSVGIGTTMPKFTLDVEGPAGPTVNFGVAALPAAFSVNGTTTLSGTGTALNVTGNATVTGNAAIQGNGNGLTFPDGTTQTTAYTRGGGGGGGSGVTQVSSGSGSGIVLSPNPITSTGTISIDSNVVPTLTANNSFSGSIGVAPQSISVVAISALGASAGSGSGQPGPTGIQATGGNGDTTNINTGGGNGIDASGGGGGYGGHGVNATGGTGVYGGAGVNAAGSSGVFGGPGVIGTGGPGTVDDGPGGAFSGGDTSADGDGLDAYAGSGLAGNFTGNVEISGTLNGSAPQVKIDNPLDPANKYLVHSSVESSERMNIYTGNITTDAQGQATVQLPDWFEALNTDFRYQLTVIGQFAQAIVAHKVQNGAFSIRTDKPNVEVSWQITAVRQDAYAKAHPLVVEEEKEARLRGYYIHPELHGAPNEKQIEWARHPEMMKKIKEHRAKQQAARKNPGGQAR